MFSRCKSQSKKLISHLLKGKFPQLSDGSIWLTPGYDHLSLKAPLCWEQLSNTENDQCTIMRQGQVFYVLCLLLPLERMIVMELSGFLALTYGLDIYRDGYQGVAWDSHEFKVIHANILEVTPTNLPLV